VNDGGWHMITLSTHPNGTRGFSIYIDGEEVRQGVNAQGRSPVAAPCSF
jgi:hypothetical protein